MHERRACNSATDRKRWRGKESPRDLQSLIMRLDVSCRAAYQACCQQGDRMLVLILLTSAFATKELVLLLTVLTFSTLKTFRKSTFQGFETLSLSLSRVTIDNVLETLLLYVYF
jgi:hypothetical protein